MRGKLYTPEEDQYLRNNLDMPLIDKAKYLGRSKSSTAGRIHHLGLIKPTYQVSKLDKLGLLRKEAVIEAHPDYRRMINQVVYLLGNKESIRDINQHGIQGGFHGFIYHVDTLRFAHKYQKMIVELLEEDAKQMGTEPVEMVRNFGCFRTNTMDSDDTRDLYRYLSLTKCKETCIPNLMAWYAAETVCRWFKED